MLQVNSIGSRCVCCAERGLRAGLRTFFWIAKMMVPITLAVALLRWAGVIELVSTWLTPIFKYIGLTGEGVVVFLTSIFASIYAAIAVIATLDLDFRSVTILAVMSLICHNLIIETVIQRKAGATAWHMVVLRIGAALLSAAALNLILPADYSGNLILNFSNSSTATDATAALHNASANSALSLDWGALPAVGWAWCKSMAELLPYMLLLILLLNVLQQILREFSLIDRLTQPLRPVMTVIGLPHQTSFLWVVMNTLGLAYGGSVLISEIERGEITPRNASLLNTHIALSHSIVEDTFLFAALGIGLGWLLVPRLLLAIAAVWCQRLLLRFVR